MKRPNDMKICFWGTPRFAVYVLEELDATGLRPTLLVCAPDKPKGRKLTLTPPDTKAWALAHDVDVLQPANIDAAFMAELRNTEWDLFLVAAYGKILPRSVIDIPSHGTLNVHPSLLPLHRGASPLQSMILAGEKEVGVTIMKLDEEMDHGPIVSQARVELEDMLPASALRELLGREGGRLLAETLPEYMSGTLTPREQEHEKATYTRKFKKEDGQIELDGNPEENYRKVLAFDDSIGTYFMAQRNGTDVRVKITDAELIDGKFVPLTVIPEGKKEMPYEDFLRGLR